MRSLRHLGGLVAVLVLAVGCASSGAPTVARVDRTNCNGLCGQGRPGVPTYGTELFPGWSVDDAAKLPHPSTLPSETTAASGDGITAAAAP